MILTNSNMKRRGRVGVEGGVSAAVGVHLRPGPCPAKGCRQQIASAAAFAGSGQILVYRHEWGESRPAAFAAEPTARVRRERSA